MAEIREPSIEISQTTPARDHWWRATAAADASSDAFTFRASAWKAPSTHSSRVEGRRDRLGRLRPPTMRARTRSTGRDDVMTWWRDDVRALQLEECEDGLQRMGREREAMRGMNQRVEILLKLAGASLTSALKHTHYIKVSRTPSRSNTRSHYIKVSQTPSMSNTLHQGQPDTLDVKHNTSRSARCPQGQAHSLHQGQLDTLKVKHMHYIKVSQTPSMSNTCTTSRSAGQSLS